MSLFWRLLGRTVRCRVKTGDGALKTEPPAAEWGSVATRLLRVLPEDVLFILAVRHFAAMGRGRVSYLPWLEPRGNCPKDHVFLRFQKVLSDYLMKYAFPVSPFLFFS